MQNKTFESRNEIDIHRDGPVQVDSCTTYNDEQVGNGAGEMRQVGQIERMLVRLVQRAAEIAVCAEPQQQEGARVDETGFARFFSVLQCKEKYRQNIQKRFSN